MSATDKLAALIAGCKAGVYVSVNEHRDYYQSVADFLDERNGGQENDAEARMDAAVRAEMIARDTVIELHFYPTTPIGFFVVFHFDLDAALTRALELLAGE